MSDTLVRLATAVARCQRWFYGPPEQCGLDFHARGPCLRESQVEAYLLQKAKDAAHPIAEAAPERSPA